MIPDKIARFVNEVANVAAFGTRGPDLVPHVHRVSGWRLDGERLHVGIPELFRADLLESLDDNGRFAITVEQFPSHETYQLKGRFVHERPLQSTDLEMYRAFSERFARDVAPVFPDVPRDLVRAYILPPGIAIECTVEEVFLQTPGPRAGMRLFPAADPPPTRQASAPERTPSGTAVALPEAIKPVLDNGIPCIMVTCARDGTPNVTVISQVYGVDTTQVALSFQFFNKTVRNVRENPRAAVCLVDIFNRCSWVLALEYTRSESTGPVFDAMDLQIEAIASATGMSGIFKLRAADIYSVLGVRQLRDGTTPEAP